MTEYKRRMNAIYTTSSGLCIFGISGSGKTVSINKILNLFPQAVQHTEYKGHSLIENPIENQRTFRFLG